MNCSGSNTTILTHNVPPFRIISRTTISNQYSPKVQSVRQYSNSVLINQPITQHQTPHSIQSKQWWGNKDTTKAPPKDTALHSAELTVLQNAKYHNLGLQFVWGPKPLSSTSYQQLHGPIAPLRERIPDEPPIVTKWLTIVTYDSRCGSKTVSSWCNRTTNETNTSLKYSK